MKTIMHWFDDVEQAKKFEKMDEVEQKNYIDEKYGKHDNMIIKQLNPSEKFAEILLYNNKDETEVKI